MAKAESRMEHSVQNASLALTFKVLVLVVGYLARIVFTHALTYEYVGINGLFIDIVNILSLSELGFGTAITYALYRPIAENDIEKQKSLMRLFRNIYRIVALSILTAGLLVVPFLGSLFKDLPDVGNLPLIYLMYLANTVLSYVGIYKKTLIDAHQRMYVGVVTQSITIMIQYVGQIIILLTTHNFILYLGIYITMTVIFNITVSTIANRQYPYLRDKDVKPLSKEEKSSISRNIRSLLMHKVGGVAVNNTDNLLLSSMISTMSVAQYSNYFLLIASVKQLFDQLFNGIAASVGNLGVMHEPKQVRNVFDTTFFIGQWLFGLASICLYELLSTFVGISFGLQYTFDSTIVLVLCINFYINGLRQASVIFHDALGLFWYDRYKAIAEAVVNLLISIVLGKLLGVIGIFLGTFVSLITTSVWIEPLVLYRNKLGGSLVSYFLRYATGCVVQALAWFATDFICVRVPLESWALLLIRAGICLVVPNLLFLICYGRSKHFGVVLSIVRKASARLLRITRRILGR